MSKKENEGSKARERMAPVADAPDGVGDGDDAARARESAREREAAVAPTPAATATELAEVRGKLDTVRADRLVIADTVTPV